MSLWPSRWPAEDGGTGVTRIVRRTGATGGTATSPGLSSRGRCRQATGSSNQVEEDLCRLISAYGKPDDTRLVIASGCPGARGPVRVRLRLGFACAVVWVAQPVSPGDLGRAGARPSTHGTRRSCGACADRKSVV